MPSPRNTLLALLCLALVGTTALCWYQFRELAGLRVTISENAALTALANSRISDLESQVAAKSRPAASPTAADANTPDSPPPGGFRGGRWQNRAEAFRKLTSSPEFQKLQQIRTEGGIESRYASLFKQLQLPPEALQQFKALLAEKQSAIQDVLASARAEGMFGPDNRAAVRSMVQQTQAQVDANIQQTIGDSAFAQYQQYEQTLPQQAAVSELAQRLSYTATPLTSDQSQQLVNILSSTASQTQAARLDGRAMMSLAVGAPVPAAPVSSAAIQQAQGILSADQLSALQQLQSEQQAQHQMQQMMRQAFQGNTGGQGTAAPTPTPAATTSGSNGGG